MNKLDVIDEANNLSSLNQFFRLALHLSFTDSELNALNLESNKDKIAAFVFDYNLQKCQERFCNVKHSELLEKAEIWEIEKKGIKALIKNSKALVNYLLPFKDFASFVGFVKEECTDPREEFAYLDSFAQRVSIPHYHFKNACLLFQKAGILDAPYLDFQLKEILKSFAKSRDTNADFFLLIKEMAFERKSSVVQLEQDLRNNARTKGNQ